MVASTVLALLGAVWVDSGESLREVNKVVQTLGLVATEGMYL
jgi:dsRNA-specific ribonuclease